MGSLDGLLLGLLAINQGPEAYTWASSWVEQQVGLGTVRGSSTCMNRFGVGDPVDLSIRNGALWEDCFWHNDIYSAAMHWAVMTCTTIGYGDIVPTNASEYYCCCVMMITMAGLWAFLISHLFVLASSADPVTSFYHQKIDAVNSFLGLYKIDKDVVRRIRRYFSYAFAATREAKHKELLHELSPELAAECAAHLAAHPSFAITRLSRVAFMHDCSPFVQLQIFTALKSAVFPPHETIDNDFCTLFILKVHHYPLHCSRVR
jgi:hypothetical protein